MARAAAPLACCTWSSLLWLTGFVTFQFQTADKGLLIEMLRHRQVDASIAVS